MKRSTDRILTSHTGALHMPGELHELLVAEWTGGEFSQQQLDDQLRASVADIVKRQAQAGIDVLNDGEFSKSSWIGYAVGRMSGFEARIGGGQPLGGKDRQDFAQFYREALE